MNKVFAFAALVAAIFSPLFSLAQTSDYFQQQVDHVISAQLDDVMHELNAEITTTYTNNSPEALEEIWMHLWPNAYSSGKTALAKQQYRNGDLFMYYAIAKDLGGIDGLDFKVDGKQTEWEYEPKNPDIAVIKLNTPLNPGESLEIYTPFKVRIPSGKISRLGHIDQSYQITQWYPKPAVYDRDGWHAMPYLGQGEFYSEYGSFDVYLTLPENYTVGATGDMPSGENNDNDAEKARLEVLNKNTREYFDAYDENTMSFNMDLSFPESSDELKTLHYHQENVHDFAWFADKRYKVLKDSVLLPHSGRAVTTWAMFTPNEEHLWQHADDYLNQSTYYYSLWNGDYPYNQVTAVDGTISAGGGMEYPNVTVIGESGSDFQLNVVIAHEVGHNWFYGILGSNERENAWMDEGLNSFNETRYLMEYYEGKDLGLIRNRIPQSLIDRFDLGDFEYRWIDELSYLLPARLGADQPLQCHSDAFSSMNYGAMVYKKTAAVMGFMKQYLGEEEFDKAMRTYFQDWKFKHPSPSDLQASMEKSCGKDLSWFFDGWIKTDGRNNWKISSAKRVENGYIKVDVKNVGEQVSPVEIAVFNDTTRVGTAWVEPTAPNEKATVVVNTKGKVATHVVLDPDRFDLDYDRKNNYSRVMGVFKKVEPIQIRSLTRLEDGNKTQIFLMPTMGWNSNSGFMSGMAVHNMVIPFRNFEWCINPMVGIRNKEFNLNGTAFASYSTGPWNAMARATSFQSNEVWSWWGSIIVPRNTNRLSFEASRKFNRVVNSPWSSKVGYEFATRFGFADDDVSGNYDNPYRLSHKLRFEATNSNAKIVGLNMNMGLECRYFNFRTPSFDPWPEAMDYYDNENVVFSGNYSIEHRLNKRGKKIKMSLLGGYIHKVDEIMSHISMPTQGFGYTYDPMADHLLLQRGNSQGILSNQAPLLYGALPSNLNFRNWMASIRFDYNLTRNIDVFCGGVYTENEADEMVGLTYRLGLLKVQMPLYSYQISQDADYKPYKYFTFSLNLRDLNPVKLYRQSM